MNATTTQQRERARKEQRLCRQCGLPTHPDLVVDEDRSGEILCLDCGVENARDRMGERLGYL